MILRIAVLVFVASAGIKSLTLGAQSTSSPEGAPATTIWDGVYTDEQAKRGQPWYVEQCGFCHGEALTEGNEAPPLAGNEFLANWKGSTLADLFDKTSTMMPMTDPGSLTGQQYADIVAYMLSVGKAPAGKTELTSEVEPMKKIRIEVQPAHEADK